MRTILGEEVCRVPRTDPADLHVASHLGFVVDESKTGKNRIIMTAAGVGMLLQRAAWSCDVDFTIYSRSYILVYGTEKQWDFKLNIEKPV